MHNIHHITSQYTSLKVGLDCKKYHTTAHKTLFVSCTGLITSQNQKKNF